MEKDHQEVVENPSGLMSSEVQKLDEKIGKAGTVSLVENDKEQPQSDQFQIRNELGTLQTSDTTLLDGKLDLASEYTDHPQISVKGFEQSGVISNDDVKSYLKETLPPEHISGERITEINYPNQYNGDDKSVTLGVCSTDNNGVSDIKIFNQTPDGSNNLDDMKGTITHEVGHNVYWNMTQQQRDNWESLSASSKPDEFVSPYARTKSTEDFAETYREYVLNSGNLQEVSSVKYDFMQNFVFNGRQYA